MPLTVTVGLQGQQKSHKFECIVCQSVQPAVSGHKYLLKYKSILQHFYPQVQSPLESSGYVCSVFNAARQPREGSPVASRSFPPCESA